MKRIIPLLPLLLCCWALASPAQQPETTRQSIVIEGATLIDGNGGAPVPESVVVIVGNRIQAVGTRGAVRYPQGAQEINAEGKFIIPGLIESHAHYPTWAGELFLAYGVTSVTDVGSSTEWAMAMKQVFERGEVKMPRLFPTGEFLTAPMSVSRGYRGTGSNGPYRTPVADVQEARLAARRLIGQGMDGIKVWQNLLPEQLRAIIEEAHQANIPVLGHVFDAEEVAELGLDRMEHTHGLLNAGIKNPENRRLLEKGLVFSGALLEEDRMDLLAELMARKNVFFDPLLLFDFKAVTKRSLDFQREARALLENPKLRYIPSDARLAMVDMYRTVRETGLGVFGGPIDRVSPEKLAEYEEGYRKNQDFVRRFVKAGGKLTAGTDTQALPPGLSLHQELQMFVDAGLSPLEALTTATRNPAESLRKLDQLGTVEAGKLADLIILNANPLDDIQNTKQIDRVMLNGKFVDTDFHPDYGAPFARPIPYEGGGHGFFMVPALRSISPRWSRAGQQVVLEAEGRDFSYASEILFEEQPLQTTFLNPARLRATVPAALLPTEGTFFVTVRNPRPGGGVSKPYGFIVLNQ